MALSENSYGTTEKVASMAARYAAKSGDFDTTTNPTKATVENFLNQASGYANIYLRKKGFDIPLENADNVLAIESIIIPVVKGIIEAEVRGTGRYAPNSKAIAARGQAATIISDIHNALDLLADGLMQEDSRPRAGDRPSSAAVTKIEYALDVD